MPSPPEFDREQTKLLMLAALAIAGVTVAVVYLA
jgi:hypothetical protein